jgi:hypothetical protein
MAMAWNNESEDSVPMTALGAETRRVSDELLARAADERRTLVLFAVALAVAVGAVLGILGAGSIGLFEISVASLSLPFHSNLAGLAGLCAAAALVISGASWLLARQRTA